MANSKIPGLNNKKISLYFIYIVTFAGILTGIFYKSLFNLVIQRSSLLFSLSPFNLFPTDLFFLPLIIIIGSFTRLRNKIIKFPQLDVFSIWFFVLAIAVIIGYYNKNLYLLGDIKDLLIRPLIAIFIFYISVKVNLEFLFKKIIYSSLPFGILLIIRNILILLNINIPDWLFSYGGSIWAEYVFLLPYSLYIFKYINEKKIRISNLIILGILSFACFSDFWKPNVASFIICTFLALLLSKIINPRRFELRKTRIYFSILLIILFVLGSLLITDSFSQVEHLVRKTYLKEYSAIRDLSGGRFEITKLGIELWKNSPIFGNGLGSNLSGYLFNSGLGRGYNYFDIIFPHNFFLQILYQLGIVGFLLIFLLVIFYIKNLFFNKKNWIYKESSYPSLILFILTIISISLFSEVMTSEVIGYLFWIIVGLERAYYFKQIKSLVINENSNIRPISS